MLLDQAEDNTVTATCLPTQVIPPQSLGKNFGWTLFANIIYSGCQWGSLVLLARIASTEQVGIYALAMAIAVPLSMVSNLNLRIIQLTDLSGTDNLLDILGLRYSAVALSFLIVCVIFLASGYGGYTAGTILLMTVAQSVESISDTYYGLLQRQERMDRIAKSMIMRGIASLIGFGAWVVFTDNVFYGVANIALVRLLVLLGYDSRPKVVDLPHSGIPAFALLRARWNPRAQATIFWKIAPLAGVSVLAPLNGNIPRYFIESCSGHKVLGAFAALSVLPSAGSMVVGALGQAAMPRLVRAFADGRSYGYKVLLWKLLLIALALGVGGMGVTVLFGGSILNLLYGAAYVSYSRLFFWLMVSGACVYATSVFGYGLTAASEFKVQLPVLCLITLITFVSSGLLIPKYSATGGAMTVAFAAAVQCAAMAALVRRSLTKRSLVLARAPEASDERDLTGSSCLTGPMYGASEK
jgi:O-antigen/teichoic acid export membrane protein